MTIASPKAASRAEAPGRRLAPLPVQAALAGHAPAALSTPQQSLLSLKATAGNAATTALAGATPTAGSGRPMASGLREQMEAHFGHDFSGVRLHTDAAAAASAADLHAKAYTVGHDIVFSAERFAPETPAGRRLLAHELAHVIQQGRGGATPALDAAAPHEASAEAAADAVAARPANGSNAGPSAATSSIAVGGATGVGVAREKEDERESHPRLTSGVAPLNRQLPPGPVTVDQVMADPEAVKRFHEIGKGTAGQVKDLTNVQGAILEEVMNREIARRIASGNDLGTLLPKGVDRDTVKFVSPPKDLDSLRPGQAAFIAGDRIRSGTPPDGRKKGKQQKLSDGMILLREQDGSLRALTVFEAKSGQRRASDLYRGEDKDDPTAADTLEKNKVAARLKKGKLIQTQLGGQIRKNVERLTPNHGDDDTTILVDGRPVPVRATPGTTRFVGVVPADVELQGAKVLSDEPKKGGHGINFGVMKLQSTEHEVKAAASDVVRVAQADKPWPLGPGPGTGRQGAAGAAKKSPRQAKTAKTAATPAGKPVKAAKPAAAKKVGPKQTLKSGAKPGRSSDPAASPSAGSDVATASKPKSKAKAKSVAKPKATSPAKKTPAPSKKTDTETVAGSGAAPKQVATASKPKRAVPTKKDATAPTQSAATPQPVQAPQKSKPPVPLKAQPVAPQAPSTAGPARAQAPTRKVAPATPVVPNAAPRASPKPDASTTPVVPVQPASTATGPKTQPSGSGAASTGRARQIATQQHAKVLSNAGQSGFGVSGGVAAQQDHGAGVSTGQQAAFGGQLRVDVQPLPNDPSRYRATLTIDLSASGSVSASRDDNGQVGGSAALSASGSLVMSYSHELSAQQAEQYRKAALGGQGGGDFAELNIARAVAENRLADAKNALAANRRQGPTLHDGDAVSLTAQGQVGGELAASASKAGGPGGGLSAGATVGGTLQIHIAKVDGKEIYTVSAESRKAWTLGGSASFEGVGGGYSRQGGKSTSRAVTFVLDPSDPNYAATRADVVGVTSLDQLQTTLGRHALKPLADSRGHGDEGGGHVSASVFGLGADIEDSSGGSEGTTVDDQGRISHDYDGHATGGLGLTAGGKTVARSTTTDSFKATVTADNKGSGESASTTRDVSYGKSVRKLAENVADRPLQTAAGLATGGTQVLQEATEVRGKKLTDASFARLSELAADPAAWGRAWQGEYTGHFVAWNDMRAKMLEANGDRNKMAKLLSDYERGDSGRSSIVERAIGETGVRFEFPDALAASKPAYEETVVADPVAEADQLAADGDKAGATHKLNQAQGSLTNLGRSIQMHSEEFSNPAAAVEMMRRIGERQTAVRAALRRIAGPAKTGSAPGATQPAATAVPAHREAAVPDTKAGVAAPPSPEQVAEANARREERNAKIQTYLPACLTMKDVERSVLAAVEEELNGFFKPDYGLVANKLNGLKNQTYPEWDKMVDQLKAVYEERGEPAARANEFAPNRGRWQAIYDRAFKGH